MASSEALGVARGLLTLLLDRLAADPPATSGTTTTSADYLDEVHKFVLHQREFKDWSRTKDRASALFNICKSRWDRVPSATKPVLLDYICLRLLPAATAPESSAEDLFESGFYLMGEELAVECALGGGETAASAWFEREEKDELACLKTLTQFEACFEAIDGWRSKFTDGKVVSHVSPWLEQVQTKLWLKLNAIVKILAPLRIKFANEIVYKMQVVLKRLPHRREEGHLDALFALYSVGERHQNSYLCQLCLQTIKRLAVDFTDHYSLIEACHLEPQDMDLLHETCRQNADFAKSVNIYLLEHKRYADLLFDELPASVEQAVDMVRPANAKELLWLCAMAQNDYARAGNILLQQEEGGGDGNKRKRNKKYDSLALLCHFAE